MPSVRHGARRIGQAALYPHWVHSAHGPWFRSDGVRPPVAKYAASAVIEKRRNLAARFGIDVFDFACP